MADEKNPIEEALKRREDADFQSFLKLRELMKMTDYEPGRKKLIKILNEYNGLDDEYNEEFIKEIEDVLQERDEANEAFLQAIKDNAVKLQKG